MEERAAEISGNGLTAQPSGLLHLLPLNVVSSVPSENMVGPGGLNKWENTRNPRS